MRMNLLSLLLLSSCLCLVCGELYPFYLISYPIIPILFFFFSFSLFFDCRKTFETLSWASLRVQFPLPSSPLPPRRSATQCNLQGSPFSLFLIVIFKYVSHPTHIRKLGREGERREGRRIEGCEKEEEKKRERE